MASENPGDHYVAAATRIPVNFVMTLDRGGADFAAFFTSLFSRMSQGESMPLAWVALAPQHASGQHAFRVESIFYAGAGQLCFGKLDQADPRVDSRESQRKAQHLNEAAQNLVLGNGATHVEIETISTLAAVVGERVLEATGQIKNHAAFQPGQRVFSESVNELLFGSRGIEAITDATNSSVLGIIRNHLVEHGYHYTDFPSPVQTVQHFASRVGPQDAWGTVPLSISSGRTPQELPLRMAFNIRNTTDVEPEDEDRRGPLIIATLALAHYLVQVRDQIEAAPALRLALETIVGMAKTVPLRTAIDHTPTPEMLEALGTVIVLRPSGAKGPPQ